MSARLVVIGVAGVLVTAAWSLGPSPPRADVRPGGPVDAIVRSMPDGSVVRLLPGLHAPFDVTHRVVIEGAEGAVVRGPIRILADAVRLSDLVVEGGEPGIAIIDADGVILERVTVRDARLHGIEVAPGSVTVRDCRIEGLRSPYAQGFEVRNSNGRPRTVVEGCTVSSGQEGLVSHVSRVEFRSNRISDTSLRSIVITEMSEGIAEGNVVSGVAGVGLYCGDESHCEFRSNTVRGVAAAPSAGRSHGGYGAVALYHATMRLRENSFEDIAAAEPVGLFLSSVETDRFPMAVWPAGWVGALPGVVVSTLALVGLVAVRAAAAPWARRRRLRLDREDPAWSRPASAGMNGLILGGFAVQSFHMLEHAVQVFQVYVAESEQRSGLLGQVVDAEWVHLTYNAAVLAFLVVLAGSVWSGRLGRGAVVGSSAVYLLAATVIQGYHTAEHVAKIVQSLAWGIDPAPGILGGLAGLVWFHFGINLSVYVGMAIGIVRLLRTGAIGLGAEQGRGRRWVGAAAGL